MNDDLQKQLAEMLAKLSATVQEGATWAGQQIPPLVQEKILLGRIESLIDLAVFAGVAYVGYRILRYCAVTLKWDVDRNERIIPFSMGGVGLCLFGSICAALSVHDVILVWFAPRLYIVEWLAGLVRK